MCVCLCVCLVVASLYIYFLVQTRLKLGFPDNCAWSATQRGAARIVVVVVAVETSESFRFMSGKMIAVCGV